MSYFASDTIITFNYPPASVTRANGGFTSRDKALTGRWVSLEADGTLRLVDENSRPIGVITTLSPGKVGITLGPICTGKQAGTTAIPLGSPITGARKIVSVGGTAERGFVKPEPAKLPLANVERRKGIVIDSADTEANTEGVSSTGVLMWY